CMCEHNSFTSLTPFFTSTQLIRSKAFLDHRHHYEELRYELIRLDYDLVARSQQLLARLNLASGVFDFAVTSTGETVFYEVNPAGQWAWLEEETGAPMTTLICDALTGATT